MLFRSNKGFDSDPVWLFRDWLIKEANASQKWFEKYWSDFVK